MMSEFLTYQYIMDTLKNVKSGNWYIDNLLTTIIPLALIINSDIRYSIFLKKNMKNIFEKIIKIQNNCCKNQICVKLSTEHDTDPYNHHNFCSDKTISIIWYINHLININSELILKNNISDYEELIINENEGYGDNTSLVVPNGSVQINNIKINFEIITDSIQKEKGASIEYRKVKIHIYSDNKKDIDDYIENTIEKYSMNLNRESNKCIKWCRLRPPSNNDECRHKLKFFSKPLEHPSEFDKLFFKGKKEFIQKLDDFYHKRINKICILLHGPPGGGKDSLLVAITKYLSELSKNDPIEGYYDLYHIVSASIDLLNSDDNFMRYMFGNDKIDGKIIEHNRQIKVIPEVEKYLPQILLKDELIENCKTTADSNDAQSKMMELLSNSTMTATDDFENIDIKSIMTAATENKQKLKKATIIECLDSFMNQNGTFCVFTTNLPLEIIDPILIRDGRLEPFEMGYSSLEVTKEIFLTKYSNDYIEKHIGLNGDFGIMHEKIMPSTISRYLNEFSTLEETIKKLQNL